MAKNKISEYSTTSSDNTDISNINIAEGCSPANVNNAIRTVMSQLKDFQSGNATYYTSNSDALAVGAGGTGAITATDARTNLSAAKSGANSDITSLTGLTTALSVAQGGTGATTAGGASFALKGANSDITSLTGLTTALSVAQGGTGSTTLTSGSVVVGNGTSAVSLVAPSTSGNVLTSDGTNWVSSSGPIGVGQTWQLPTRVSGTSYTNSTGKPIQVIVYITQVLAGSGTSVVVVGGVTIVNGNYQSNATGGSQPISYSFIVPNSTSYTVTVTGGCSLGVWAELR